MPLVTLSNPTYFGEGIWHSVWGQTQRAFSHVHTGGYILVLWQGSSGGGNDWVHSLPATIGITGQPDATLLFSQSGGANSTVGVWRSTVPLAAATYTINVPVDFASTGMLEGFSVANWTGNISARTTAIGTLDLTHDVTAAVTDLVIGMWSYQYGGGASGFSPVTGTMVSSSGTAASDPAGDGTMTTAQATYCCMKRAGVGGATTVTVSRNGTWTGNGLSLAFALIGVTTQTFTQAVGGNLNFSGALTRQSLRGKSLTGSLSFNGTLTGAAKKLRVTAGILTFSGALTQRKALARQVAGALSFSGDLTRRMQWQRSLQGVLSFAGSVLPKTAAKVSTAGSLGFQGSLTRMSIAGQILDGLLNFSGGVVAIIINASRRFTVALFAQLTVVHNRLRR